MHAVAWSACRSEGGAGWTAGHGAQGSGRPPRGDVAAKTWTGEWVLADPRQRAQQRQEPRGERCLMPWRVTEEAGVSGAEREGSNGGGTRARTQRGVWDGSPVQGHSHEPGLGSADQ